MPCSPAFFAALRVCVILAKAAVWAMGLLMVRITVKNSIFR